MATSQSCHTCIPLEESSLSFRNYLTTYKRSGRTETAGRRASGYTVEPMDKNISIPLPTLLECNQIPNICTKIPTPDAAYHDAHLKRTADKIPHLDPNAKILLLLGRNTLRGVREQISGPGDAPFAQRLDLGWVVVGDVCLGGAHRPLEVSSHPRHWSCESSPAINNLIKVKEVFGQVPQHQHYLSPTTMCVSNTLARHDLGIFTRTPDVNRLGPSMED